MSAFAGILWALGSAVAFSITHVAVRRAVVHLGVALGTLLMLVVATVTIGSAALLIDQTTALAAATTAGLLYFAAAGLIHFVGGWSFMNASARLIGAARMSAATAASPLFAAILAVLAFNEDLNVLIASGVVLIAAGTYLIATG